MKFVALLVAAAAAADCAATADCAADTECCGTATPQEADSGTEHTTCQDATATSFADDDGYYFDFACLPEEAEGSAGLKFTAAAAAVAIASYF